MQTKTRTHNIELIFSLALFLVFLFCAVFVILTGVSVYKTSVDKSETNYQLRTTLAYIQEKVNVSDAGDNIDIVTLKGDTAALSIGSNIEGKAYHTYIYELDGYMYELFIKDELEADPYIGERLLESGSLTFEKNDKDLIKVSLTDETGHETFIYIHPSSKGGVS